MTDLMLGALLLVLVLAAGSALFTLAIARRITRAMPPTGRFLDMSGERLHYVERGAGPAILCIHGLTGHLGNFSYGLLDRLAVRHRVVLVDRPGSGHSFRSDRKTASLTVQADLLAEVVERLGLDRPLVVGHSLGGALALTLALRHPDRLRGLALVAPLTQAQKTVPAAFRLLYLRSQPARYLVAWTLSLPLAILRRGRVLAIVFGPDEPPRDFAQKGAAYLSLLPRSFVAASEDLIAIGKEMPGLSPRFADLACPVAILYGRGDRILSPKAEGETLRRALPDLRLDLVDGGHMLPVTAPDIVAEWIDAVDATISVRPSAGFEPEAVATGPSKPTN